MKHRQRLRKPHRRWFCIQTILPGLTLPHSPRCAAPQGLHHEKKHSAVKIMSAFKTELKQFKNRWKNIYVCVNIGMIIIKGLEVSQKSIKMYISFSCALVCYHLSKYFFSMFLTCHWSRDLKYLPGHKVHELGWLHFTCHYIGNIWNSEKVSKFYSGGWWQAFCMAWQSSLSSSPPPSPCSLWYTGYDKSNPHRLCGCKHPDGKFPISLHSGLRQFRDIKHWLKNELILSNMKRLIISGVSVREAGCVWDNLGGSHPTRTWSCLWYS